VIRPKLEWFVLTVGLLASSMLAQQPTTPEPADLQVQFRAATGSSRFRIGEVITVEVLLSSTTPNRYLEPCALFRESNFGFPQCRFFSRWSFAIVPDSGWVDYTKEFDGPRTGGGPTFEVPNHVLTSQPVTFSYVLTHRFRFDKPGGYQVRLSINVGLNDTTAQLNPRPDPSVQPQFASVTREIALQIVPAEAGWQKEIVRKGAEAYFAPRPRETNPPSQSLLEYEQAKQALCTLGSPEAARVLAKVLLPADFEAQNCLERSPSLRAGIEEMQRLLVDPDVAVSPTFFSALVGFLNIDESKKVGGLFLSQQVVDKERDALFAALPQKRGDAQVSSLATVLQYPSRTKSKPMDDAYDLPFPPPVIAVAAANFDRLPRQTQQLLLEDGWDRIRSPLMLPVVCRKAEAGDGPALLRWLELEPVPATDFIRKEIVRAQPRFSSYYLRLSDVSLPAQENQIAANFAGFAALKDDHDLVHSATLLHRYATGTVLWAVLPFIDGKLTEWPCSIQVPVLAYLLKVAPEEAAARVDKALKSTNKTQVCTGRLLTTLGFLEPGPVLERLAIAQIETGGPAAADGAHYLERYAPLQLKPKIWEQLESLRRHFVSSGAEKRVNDGAGTPDDMAKSQLVNGLVEAFEKAQAWVLTPEDEDHLQALLNKDAISQLKCNFQCSAPLSVGPGHTEYAIYGRVNPTVEERQNARESMEYLNSSERLRYSINQYECDDLKRLKDKIIQFPPGSTFVFAYGLSARDRNELIEISNFILDHGYKRRKVQEWVSLPPDSSH
jgi:hypothetical protein